MNNNIEKLVTDNLGLVGNEIAKLNRAGLNEAVSSWDDLYQIGSIGLINAARLYDETKGYKFSTYAAKCIKTEILKGLESNTAVSLESEIYEDVNLLETIACPEGIDMLSDTEAKEYLIECIEDLRECKIRNLDKYKDMFLLVYEGYSVSDAAKLLGETESFAAKFRAFRKTYFSDRIKNHRNFIENLIS